MLPQNEDTRVPLRPQASREAGVAVSLRQAGLRGWQKGGPVGTPGHFRISKSCLTLNLQVTARHEGNRAGRNTNASWGLFQWARDAQRTPTAAKGQHRTGKGACGAGARRRTLTPAAPASRDRQALLPPWAYERGKPRHQEPESFALGPTAGGQEAKCSCLWRQQLEQVNGEKKKRTGKKDKLKR